MGKLFDKFVESKNIDKKLTTGIDLFMHGIPWGVGLGFFFGGAYGLEAYLATDFSKGFVENLKKNKFLSDAQEDFYTFFGDKIVEEADYKKNRNKKLCKVPEDSSLISAWKSVYDK